MREFLNNTIGKLTDRVDWLNVPTGTYVRYILAIVAAVNAILNTFGLTPIELRAEPLYDFVSAVLFIGVLFVNTYKDNPTSPEAIKSNKYLKQLQFDRKNPGTAEEIAEDTEAK